MTEGDSLFFIIPLERVVHFDGTEEVRYEVAAEDVTQLQRYEKELSARVNSSVELCEEDPMSIVIPEEEPSIEDIRRRYGRYGLVKAVRDSFFPDLEYEVFSTGRHNPGAPQLNYYAAFPSFKNVLTEDVFENTPREYTIIHDTSKPPRI